MHPILFLRFGRKMSTARIFASRRSIFGIDVTREPLTE